MLLAVPSSVLMQEIGQLPLSVPMDHWKAINVDYVEEVEASVERSRRITVPRTPENTALLSRWPVEKHLSQLLRTFSAFI